MNMPAPKSLRLHIGIFGRRNVGKSSLVNTLTRQLVSIVSDTAGTTTDPVDKAMELLPLGPVLFIDTAGIDDDSALGEARIGRTRAMFDRTDVGLIVADDRGWGNFEEELRREMAARRIPVIAVFNKADLGAPTDETLAHLAGEGVRCIRAAASSGEGMDALREALIRMAPDDFINPPSILSDLVPPGELAVLVTPIDKEAPKGRLIMPQVQSIRDLLDHGCICMVAREHELRASLARLNRPPALVVTDSQAFARVAEEVPDSIPLTSFSILFARYKGDLDEFARGARAIGKLRPGDRILIAEACSHHPIGEDIGRVKIPAWLTAHAGGKLDIRTTQGHDFPQDLSSYGLVVHCGACTFNRREVLSRISRCRTAGVPITNYGLAIAWSLGIFDRALRPFSPA